jgi:predicted amidohydrolase
VAGTLAEQLAQAQNLWQLTRLLLAEVRARPPAEGSARRQNDERYLVWSSLGAAVVDYFDQRDPAVDDEARRQVLAWTGNGGDVDSLDAVAWGLDVVGAEGFASAWRDECLTAGDSRHRLVVDELYPVSDAAKELFRGLRLSSRPASLTRTAPDELPHVRAHHDAGYDVFVDFSRDRDLEQLGAGLRVLAAAHPNQSSAEFVFERPAPEIVFPVHLDDEARQEERLVALVERALAAGAGIVVFPELAATAGTEAKVRAILDEAESQHLVVLGSRHVGTGKSAQNLALALTPEGGDPIVHAKVIPFSDELRLAAPWKEGIAISERPELTLYQADRFRFCILICKDFLDQTLTAALARLGVNVLCVPAMSEKTSSYRLRVGQLVADAQAIVVVANNPLEWDAGLVDPVAIFGQPVAGHEAVLSPGAEPIAAPALSLLRLGDSTATIAV